MQDHVYQTRIPDVNDIKQRLFDAWAAAAQMIRPIYYFTNLNFGKKSSSTHILLSVGQNVTVSWNHIVGSIT